MNTYDKSSLVLIPSGIKDGKIYSQRPENGDGDFTFSRGSNLAATRVDENGLIEKGRENLLLQSNTFSSSDWTKANGATITGGQSGYDGTSNAWLFTANTGIGYLLQINTAGLQTFSIYAKQNTLSYLYVSPIGGGAATTYFDLSTGNVGTQGLGAIDAKMVNAGGGWWRCSITSLNQSQYRMYLSDSDPVVAGSTGSIYIQDAQLEAGLVATDYIETTTTTAQAGILEDMPRLDYSGSCPSLLLEPTRTNLVLDSEYFMVWPSGGGTNTRVPNAATSPEGLQNATSIQIDSGYVYRSIGGLSISNGDKWVWSCYVNSSSQKITFGGGSVAGTDVYSSEDVGGGWYRQKLTRTFTTSGSTIQVMFNASIAGTDLFYIWGAQLESGSYPTSYIPTYGSAVTRNQDSCNVSGLAQSFPFTAYIEIDVFSTSVYNQFQFRQDASNYVLRLGNTIIVGNAALSNTNTLGSNKFALSVDASGNFELFKNGTSLGNGTITQIIDEIRSDAAGYEVKEIILFSTALTNEELAALTTI